MPTATNHSAKLTLNIAWWNVNGKLDICEKEAKWINNYDIVFVLETHGKLPSIENFEIAAKFNSAHGKRGGLAAYTKKELVPDIFDVQSNECYIGFRLKQFPNYCFVGIYIPPCESIYYNDTCFADTIAHLLIRMNIGQLLFVGGDFNSRPGNLQRINPQNRFRYRPNTDQATNTHGTQFGDLCRTTNLIPLNHLEYGNKHYDGQYTYYKGNKKSQIDYVLTDKNGLNCVEELKFINKDWHASDHVPITISVNIQSSTDLKMLYVRSCELNATHSATNYKPRSMKKVVFDTDACTTHLLVCRPALEHIIQTEDPTSLCEKLTTTLQQSISTSIHKSKVRRNEINQNNMENIMNDANIRFNEYQNTLVNNLPQDTIREASLRYEVARNKITPLLIEQYHKSWSDMIAGNSDRDIWKRIDWNGKLIRKVPPNPPQIEEMANHFKELYAPSENESLADIAAIQTNIYIPVLDDDITMEEVHKAGTQMKKGGFDFSNKVIGPLMQSCGDIIWILMNLIFGAYFPICLGMSMLCALPKKGDLSLTKNYRGIQMMPLIAAWYDRIIANRLTRWIAVNYEQTAFQKGKSTIHQIITLRLIIALCKKKRKPLYLAFFDLEKAFDKVSRKLLLQKLIQLGIGHCMLEALKRIYSSTHCILQFMGQISEQFQTFCGIKQGAHSSVLLFIVFMDGAINYLKTKCEPETILNDLHCLLHADDTVIISTNKEAFATKCNHLIDYFTTNKLKLNMGKSAYMIINPNKQDNKDPLRLAAGLISYRSIYTYLGVPITDNGSIPYDLKEHIKIRRPNVMVKLTKFLQSNINCPITIKLKILKACVCSSLLYGCEAWGAASITNLETIYRKTIKMTLGVRNNIPNDIITCETGLMPLKAHVQHLQKQFWTKLLKDAQEHPDAPITRLIAQARINNLPIISHYNNLYESNNKTARSFGEEAMREATNRLRITGQNDVLSKAGQYLKVNPELQANNLYNRTDIPESDRIIITRYICGSHKLKIETGRWNKTPREERLCTCQMECQTLDHMMYRCPLTENQGRPNIPIEQFINKRECAKLLRKIETLT